MSISLIVIILLNGLISYSGFNNIQFFRKFEFHVRSILSGEHFRIISSGFLHVDLMHIMFNMYSLYIFAPIVIYEIGELNFVILYLCSLIVGNLFTLIMYKNQLDYRAVGASGAVMGVLYAAILLYPESSLYLFFIPIAIPAYIFGIIYLLYSIYGMKSNSDNIGHTAHLGGAITGFVFIIVNNFTIIQEKLFHVVLLLIPIIILFTLIKMKKI